MNRKSFFKSLLSAGTLSILPKHIDFIPQQKIALLQCFIAGFAYYEGPKILSKMKLGAMLDLQREPNNQYDPSAIALYYEGKKVGFIPRSENFILSTLIDTNALQFAAEISHINHEAETWENVEIALYYLKKIDLLEIDKYKDYIYSSEKTSDDNPPYNIWQYSELEQDYTIYTNNRFDWAEFLEENALDDRIYDIIHGAELDLEQFVDSDNFFVIHRDKWLSDNEVAASIDIIEKTMDGIEELFDEKGYIVLSIEEAEAFIPKLQKIATIIDKQGRKYLELT